MNIAKTAIMLSLALCILVLPLREALAHGGGLDRNGCHGEASAGGYHCHRGEDEDETDWETIGLVLGGAVVLIVVWACLEDEDDDVSSSLRLQVSEDGMADLGYSLGETQQIGVRTATPADDSEDAYLGAYWRLAF